MTKDKRVIKHIILGKGYPWVLWSNNGKKMDSICLSKKPTWSSYTITLPELDFKKKGYLIFEYFLNKKRKKHDKG